MLSKKLTKEFLTKRLINKLKVEGFEFGSSQDLNKTVDYILNNYLDTAIMIEEGTIKESYRISNYRLHRKRFVY